MKKEKGFSLIELLIVVAIIGIIAAIAIPALLRARLNANESATIGDVRTVISASATYQANTASKLGFAPTLTCLSSPANANCIPNYSTASPVFLDPAIGLAGIVTKSGYNRSYFIGNVANNEADSYCYATTPTTNNRTGVRSFGGDDTGVVGETIGPAGNVPSIVCCGAGGVPGTVQMLTANCQALK